MYMNSVNREGLITSPKHGLFNNQLKYTCIELNITREH